LNLTEFARALGLSISTVSRAMNGYADVSPATRARVAEAAERLGYVANAGGRLLRTGRVEAIGVVLSPPQSSFVNAFYLDILTGIDEALQVTPYHLLVTTARSPEDELRILRRLVEARRVDAILFGRTRRDDPRIAYLQAVGFPFATVGRSEAAAPFAHLDIDHVTVGREAAARLTALGHREVALLNTPAPLMYSHHCRLGFEAGLAAAGLAPAAVVADEQTEEGGYRAARTVLAGHSRPTGLVCGSDLMALGAMRALGEAGLAPGRDVAVIGCDDHPLARYATPPLTTFTVPLRAAGRRVAEILLAVMDGAPPAGLQEVWIPELVIRASDSRAGAAPLEAAR
jgi:LacI family transcriptional regulator